ncbi:hypothetical protein CRYUN_Cryun26dG0011000 [Craigia yunnanensis]
MQPNFFKNSALLGSDKRKYKSKKEVRNEAATNPQQHSARIISLCKHKNEKVPTCHLTESIDLRNICKPQCESRIFFPNANSEAVTQRLPDSSSSRSSRSAIIVEGHSTSFLKFSYDYGLAFYFGRRVSLNSKGGRLRLINDLPPTLAKQGALGIGDCPYGLAFYICFAIVVKLCQREKLVL